MTFREYVEIASASAVEQALLQVTPEGTLDMVKCGCLRFSILFREDYSSGESRAQEGHSQDSDNLSILASPDNQKDSHEARSYAECEKKKHNGGDFQKRALWGEQSDPAPTNQQLYRGFSGTTPRS